jgi:hypothetical protein
MTPATANRRWRHEHEELLRQWDPIGVSGDAV